MSGVQPIYVCANAYCNAIFLGKVNEFANKSFIKFFITILRLYYRKTKPKFLKNIQINCSVNSDQYIISC